MGKTQKAGVKCTGMRAHTHKHQNSYKSTYLGEFDLIQNAKWSIDTAHRTIGQSGIGDVVPIDGHRVRSVRLALVEPFLDGHLGNVCGEANR